MPLTRSRVSAASPRPPEAPEGSPESQHRLGVGLLGGPGGGGAEVIVIDRQAVEPGGLLGAQQLWLSLLSEIEEEASVTLLHRGPLTVRTQLLDTELTNRLQQSQPRFTVGDFADGRRVMVRVVVDETMIDQRAQHLPTGLADGGGGLKGAPRTNTARRRRSRCSAGSSSW